MTLLNSSLITNIFPHHNFSSKLISYRFTSSTGCLRIFSQFLTKWLFLITNFYLLSFHFNQGYNIGILFYNGYDFNALKPHTNFWVPFHKKQPELYASWYGCLFFRKVNHSRFHIRQTIGKMQETLFSADTCLYTFWFTCLGLFWSSGLLLSVKSRSQIILLKPRFHIS